MKTTYLIWRVTKTHYARKMFADLLWSLLCFFMPASRTSKFSYHKIVKTITNSLMSKTALYFKISYILS